MLVLLQLDALRGIGVNVSKGNTDILMTGRRGRTSVRRARGGADKSGIAAKIVRLERGVVARGQGIWGLVGLCLSVRQIIRGRGQHCGCEAGGAGSGHIGTGWGVGGTRILEIVGERVKHVVVRGRVLCVAMLWHVGLLRVAEGIRVWLEGRDLVGLADPGAGGCDVVPGCVGYGVIHELGLMRLHMGKLDINVKELLLVVCLRVEGRGRGVLGGGDMERMAGEGLGLGKVVAVHIDTKHFGLRMMIRIGVDVVAGRQGVVRSHVEHIHGRYGRMDVSD